MFDLFKKKRHKDLPEVYSEADLDALEAGIQHHLGTYETVFHELVSPDIHVDIAIIPPAEGRNYYALCTMGMGAHRMTVPKSRNIPAEELAYAEMVILLPAHWEIQNGDERWYWPIRWLKMLARLPIEQDTWLGFGHSIPNGEPFAEDTELCGVVLCDMPSLTEDGFMELRLPSGRKVHFLLVVPVYLEEMALKLDRGMDALLERFEAAELPFPPVVDKERPNTCL